MSEKKDYNAIGNLTIEEISPGLLQDIKDIAVEVAGIEEANTTTFDSSKYQQGHVMYQVDDVQEAIDKLTDLVDNTATSEEDGLISKEDKIKLDSIEAGATKTILNNTVTSESTTEAATANAVKMAYDKASQVIIEANAYTDEKTSNLVSNVQSSEKINTLEVYKNDGTMEEIILNIKGATSDVNNVFRSGGIKGEFIAQETTSTFTIENIDNTKEVFLTYQGSVLIENKEFKIDKSNGLVTLEFSLEPGECIDYEVISTSFDFYDLINIPTSFTPSEHTHNDKMDKLIIMPKSSDLNQDLSMGIYHFFNVSSNFPPGYVSEDNDFILQVVSSGVNNYLWQTQTLTDIRSGKQFRRAKLAGTYGAWQEITTTEAQTLKAPNARGSSTTPSDYINSFKVIGLKTGAECGLDGKESFVHVFGINGWVDTTAGVVEFLVGGTGKLYKRYRKNATEWNTPVELATTERVEILSCLKNNWVVAPACDFSAQKIGNRLFIESVIYNTDASPHLTIATGLPIPSDGKWHGGASIGNNGKALYVAVSPYGELMYQMTSPASNVYHTISINYPVN